MKENKQYFDLSESSIDWLQDNGNYKKLGCFKDENASYIIKEFLALSPQVYCFIHDSDKGKDNEKKVLKGVSNSVIKNDITYKDYKSVLDTNETIIKTITSIRSFDHQVCTFSQEKKALSSYQDKSYMLPNGIDCVPFGYKPNARPST